jgi:ribonuclease BN (tRNA processing enzyme)
VKVRILGCSGGIGEVAGEPLRTTSILVDDDILIDCGTGVGDLTIAELARIDHVFLTHSHLDHIACLPMLIDTTGDLRDRPLTVHAIAGTLEILRAHVFNWSIWPDFLEIPSPAAPCMRFDAIDIGVTVSLGERSITPLPVRHTVPAVAFQIASNQASMVFSGDTGPSPELWDAINRIDDLRYLLFETSYPEAERNLAEVSGHLCPGMFAEELARLHRPAEILITHLNPTQPDRIMAEIEARGGSGKVKRLRPRQIFDL